MTEGSGMMLYSSFTDKNSEFFSSKKTSQMPALMIS